MNPTKLIQTVVAVIAVVWLFTIGFVLGMRNVRKDLKSAPADTSAATVYTTAPTTETTTAPTTAASTTETTAPASTDLQPSASAEQPASSDPSQAEPSASSEATQPVSTIPTSTQEIVDAYVSAVNKTKSLQNFSLVRQDALNLSLDEITGGSLVKSVANSIVASQSEAQNATQNLTYVNGVDAATGETVDKSLPPLGGTASLDPNAVTQATCTPNSYGGYTIFIALQDETQTIESPAPNHATTMEVIDVAAIGLPEAFQMTKLDITYSGSNITADTDAEGRIVTMKHYLNVNHAEGVGQYSAIKINAVLHGDFTGTYTLSY